MCSIEEPFGFFFCPGFGEVVDLDELKGGESRPSVLMTLIILQSHLTSREVRQVEESLGYFSSLTSRPVRFDKSKNLLDTSPVSPHVP
jgi:hypothetical protein